MEYSSKQIPFDTYKVNVHRNTNQIKLKQFYDKTKQRRHQIANKINAQAVISKILQKWQNRKLEQEAESLQKAADKHDYTPIWKYQKTYSEKENIQILFAQKR